LASHTENERLPNAYNEVWPRGPPGAELVTVSRPSWALLFAAVKLDAATVLARASSLSPGQSRASPSLAVRTYVLPFTANADA
jgi:hypothetical protein